MGLNTLVDLLPSITREKTCDFLLAFAQIKSLLKRGLLKGEQILSFRIDPFQKGGKNNICTFASPESVSIRLKRLRLGLADQG